MTGQNERTVRIMGQKAMTALETCRVAVFGIGGVGGAAAEALARGGIGALDLIDKDTVELSNINRQIVALHSTVGQKKTAVMEERIRQINPSCSVVRHDMFYLPENADQIDLRAYDYIVDAIDTVTAKIELIVRACDAGIPIISSMGAGNRFDASAFRVMDLYQTSIDPLARVMRRELKGRGVKHLKVVCSSEAPGRPVSSDGDDRTPGSVSFVPPAAGLLMAGEVIMELSGVRESV